MTIQERSIAQLKKEMLKTEAVYSQATRPSRRLRLAEQQQLWEEFLAADRAYDQARLKRDRQRQEKQEKLLRKRFDCFRFR